jgi:5-methyltetrahydrofolate--homocysteine methyltransferase
MDEKLSVIFDAIVDGDDKAATQGVAAALEAGIDPATILDSAMMAAMTEVGRQFEEGEAFVPEMMIAAMAMKAGLALLKPHLQPGSMTRSGTVVIGTVKGDLHDIGKNLVAMMLEGAGFQVIDLGVDVKPEAFVKAVEEHRPDLIGMSALLTTTMAAMAVTIKAIAGAGLRDSVKIMIGGAAVSDLFAAQIGADGYAPDAGKAVALAQALRAGQGRS